MMLSAFKDWHDRAQKLLGKEDLEAIYQRCYGVEWQFIKETIDPLDDLVIHELEPWWRVLEIQPSASSLQVEQAYKRLVRTVSSFSRDREQKVDPNLWFNKLQGWLKPLFSR